MKDNYLILNLQNKERSIWRFSIHFAAMESPKLTILSCAALVVACESGVCQLEHIQVVMQH